MATCSTAIDGCSAAVAMIHAEVAISPMLLPTVRKPSSTESATQGQ